MRRLPQLLLFAAFLTTIRYCYGFQGTLDVGRSTALVTIVTTLSQMQQRTKSRHDHIPPFGARHGLLFQKVDQNVRFSRSFVLWNHQQSISDVQTTSIVDTSRRKLLVNMYTIVSATTTIVVGESSSATEAAAPSFEADPLVTFGERLSQTSAGKNVLDSTSNANPSSSWPENAAHPLPIMMDTDDIGLPSSESSAPMNIPPSLEQVIQLQQTKKQINPTTHG
jgi:hypothetical protein